jgi:hypothetical protein
MVRPHVADGGDGPDIECSSEYISKQFQQSTMGGPPVWCLVRRWTVLENSGNLEICGLLGYYTASCGNYLPTFRDNVSVPSSRVKISNRKESL